jgi:hypothetical protein
MAEAEPWWMVGCDGSVPHFYQARTGRSAVAKFRANLIEMERGGAGLSLKDARYIVRALEPQVIDGPLTAQQAYDVDLGWLWATAMCDQHLGAEVIPSGPATRGQAVDYIGEDQVIRMERSARKRYRLNGYGQGKDTVSSDAQQA